MEAQDTPQKRNELLKVAKAFLKYIDDNGGAKSYTQRPMVVAAISGAEEIEMDEIATDGQGYYSLNLLHRAAIFLAVEAWKNGGADLEIELSDVTHKKEHIGTWTIRVQFECSLSPLCPCGDCQEIAGEEAYWPPG